MAYRDEWGEYIDGLKKKSIQELQRSLTRERTRLIERNEKFDEVAKSDATKNVLMEAAREVVESETKIKQFEKEIKIKRQANGHTSGG